MKKIFISLVLIAVQTAPALAVTSTVVRPSADGAVSQWSVTPSGSHYATVNEEVVAPNAGDEANYLSVPGTGRNGSEKDELVFAVPTLTGAVKSVKLWIYGKNSGCRGGGSNNCDSLILGVNDQTYVSNVKLNVGSYGWTAVTYDLSSAVYNGIDYTPASYTLFVTRQAKGGGNNNDELKIATIYAEVITE